MRWGERGGDTRWGSSFSRRLRTRDDQLGLASTLNEVVGPAGALQALGAVLNAELRGALTNPWLAADVSFIPVLAVFVLVFLLRPYPLPTPDDLKGVR